MHCCLNSALIAEIAPGTTVFRYLSGAWLNHNPGGAWLGYLRIEVPALSLASPLGTESPMGFPSAQAAEQAAAGDSIIVENNAPMPVNAYLYAWDSCLVTPAGYCHDNLGQVRVEKAVPLVATDPRPWTLIKSLYRDGTR